MVVKITTPFRNINCTWWWISNINIVHANKSFKYLKMIHACWWYRVVVSFCNMYIEYILFSVLVLTACNIRKQITSLLKQDILIVHSHVNCYCGIKNGSYVNMVPGALIELYVCMIVMFYFNNHFVPRDWHYWRWKQS